MDVGVELAGRYAAMSEGELLGVARGYEGLTEAAQGALRAEFARRGLEAPLVEDEAAGGRLVTIARYRDLSEGIVARSLLESAGIAAELRDENLIRLDWQISNFIGGLRLQVESGEAEAAREILAQPVPEEFYFGALGEYEQPRCPRCGSVEITFEGASRGAALLSLYVAGVPLPGGRETWRCAGCGAKWEEDSERE